MVGTLAGCATQEKQIKNAKTLVAVPELNKKLVEEDFAFPERPPRLSRGKVVFEQNCASCHAGKAMATEKMMASRPIDTYLFLTKGDGGKHPAFRQLTRDQRWEAVFYARHLAGESQIANKDIAAVFGGNCAVCHGAKGFADGPLHSGHGSAHELGMAPVKNQFNPPPANFHSYARMYNRTNNELIKFIEEGLYPSAMPSWKGRADRDKNVVFDRATITDLVKYIRGFAYDYDLEAAPAKEAPKTSALPKKPVREVSALMPESGENRIR
jgi:mono/diheme cytochrome c family protein